jgi:flagellar biosynthesis/type III secretory pathway chaperone
MAGLSGFIDSARLLSLLLDEEFEALKAQDLEHFERLQPNKVDLLKKISQVPPPKANSTEGSQGSQAGLSAEWEGFQQLVRECRDRHQRNAILIQRKLDAIRSALRTLQGADATSSVEVYDRLGRLAANKRRSSYTDA